MFGSIRDRIYSLDIADITTSVKNLAPVSVQDGYVIPWPANPTASGTSATQLSRNKVRAGSEILDHWQTCWEQIHKANEKNIKKANRCEKLISEVKAKTCDQWSNVMTLQGLVGSHVPLIANELQTAMSRLGEMESIFEEVEVSLMALEESVEAREAHEKQVEERFQLTMYQEKKRAALSDLSRQLQSQLDRRREEVEARSRRDKQNFYQTLFERDMEAHKQSRLQQKTQGATSSATDKSSSTPTPTDDNGGGQFLRLPKTLHDQDASLETIDLNDDPNDQTLERFLREEDALYDLSPLPRDPSKNNLDSVEGSAFLEETEEGLQGESATSSKAYQRNSIEESTPALEVQTSLSVPVVTMTSSESVAESLYFTPETSVTEKLSEFAGEDK